MYPRTMSGRISARVEGIDVARGLAGLVMIQGHAFHAWVADEHHGSLAYKLTRVLGTLPLPAFLVLAGAAVAFRVDAAARRGEDARDVRRGLIIRGLQVILWGYVVSGVYALIDGGVDSLATLLRADVLHVIGLSIAVVAFLGVRPGCEAAPEPRRLLYASTAVGLAAVLACPWATELARTATGPSRYALALFAEVPLVTRMPFVPLAAWFSAGVAAAFFMMRMRDRRRATDRGVAIAGAPAFALVALGAAASCVAIACAYATPALVGALGGTLSRAHPAVWLNALDLAARGVLLLCIGALVAPHVPERARAVLLRLGRGSLVAYVFHIPFCYGRPGASLLDGFDVVGAMPWVLALMVTSFAVVWMRDELRERLASVRITTATG